MALHCASRKGHVHASSRPPAACLERAFSSSLPQTHTRSARRLEHNLGGVTQFPVRPRAAEGLGRAGSAKEHEVTARKRKASAARARDSPGDGIAVEVKLRLNTFDFVDLDSVQGLRVFGRAGGVSQPEARRASIPTGP